MKELLGIRKGAESQENLPAFVVFLFPPTHPGLLSDITGEKGSEGGGEPPSPVAGAREKIPSALGELDCGGALGPGENPRAQAKPISGSIALGKTKTDS